MDGAGLYKNANCILCTIARIKAFTQSQNTDGYCADRAYTLNDLVYAMLFSRLKRCIIL